MFKMTFEFEDGYMNGVLRINEALAGMELSRVSVKDCSGPFYSLDEEDPDTGEPTGKSFIHPIQSVELACERDEDMPLHHWQVESLCFAEGTYVDTGTLAGKSGPFREDWLAQHPDRDIIQVTSYWFGDGERTLGDAFVIVHRERTA